MEADLRNVGCHSVLILLECSEFPQNVKMENGKFAATNKLKKKSSATDFLMLVNRFDGLRRRCPGTQHDLMFTVPYCPAGPAGEACAN